MGDMMIRKPGICRCCRKKIGISRTRQQPAQAKPPARSFRGHVRRRLLEKVVVVGNTGSQRMLRYESLVDQIYFAVKEEFVEQPRQGGRRVFRRITGD